MHVGIHEQVHIYCIIIMIKLFRFFTQHKNVNLLIANAFPSVDNRHKSVRNGHAIFAWNNCTGVKVEPAKNIFPPHLEVVNLSTLSRSPYETTFSSGILYGYSYV